PDVMRTMGQQAFNSASSGIGVVDAVSLDREPPGFVEGRLIVGCVRRGGLDGLHEEGSRIGCLAEQSWPVPVDIGIYCLKIGCSSGGQVHVGEELCFRSDETWT